VFYKSATARQPIDEADAHRKLAAEGLSRFLPARADPLRLYRVGPQPRLVGTAAPAIGAAPTVGTLSVADLDQWAHVSAASGEVPVLVTARVSGMHAGVIELDVNGRVAAVVPTYGSGGRDVAALLPESMLHDGSNTLRAYVVDGGARKPLDVRAA
jgi:hypothetical protein